MTRVTTQSTDGEDAVGDSLRDSVRDSARAVSASGLGAPIGSGARPVMTDVAQRAGVSQKTVSRVVRGEANVSDAVRERVNAAIAELGFRPNAAARALVSKRSNAVGILTPATALYGPSAELLGLERAAGRAGLAVLIASAEGGDAQTVTAAIRRLVDSGVDGLLMGSLLTSEGVDETELHGKPAVVVGDPPEGMHLPAAVTDQKAGARAAIEHLLTLGHRTVHHLAGPAAWHSAAARTEAWQQALRAAGRPLTTPAMGDWTSRSGYELGRRLAADPDVTAVFVGNDQMAIGLLRALTEAGRRVPEDVSVVGFDDIPDAEYLPVPLTTVKQDFQELADRAVEMFTSLVDEGATNHADHHDDRLIVTPELVVRRSTAPPPASGR
ncbi:LacI family DNA-binding transcriptional regulator [Ruania alkalisoli]|uniref:LacI family DNA-binding transcriptional regulator n=1 Tax=Ruania alkalisoli TaxID=2779775 RepID=A0A7M1SVL6_9MICO|nr:LacI family DNA-binding transcriptional regulator [Ruania alkalisoli]QOR71620.1 LacI family DNA-binding transcriptional regulator [Ruania alkalisoli]